MSDRLRPKDANLTPIELNSKLIELFRQVPTKASSEIELPLGSINNVTDINAKIHHRHEEFEGLTEQALKGAVMKSLASFMQTTRRRNSQHKEILVDRFRTLLAFSRTSSSFQEFILEDFARDYDAGVDFINPDTNASAWMLDIEDPQSGGIFDPARAQEIESVAYMQLMSAYQYFQEQPDLISSRHPTDHRTHRSYPLIVGDRVPAFKENIRIRLTIWADEFTSLHCTEPPMKI